MTIRFRTICHDTTREFAFDRKSISVGRAPFNDVALTGCAIAEVHGDLEIHEGDALVFRARASSEATRVMRDGECTQSSDGVEEQVFHIRPGDAIWLGESPAVRLEVLGLDKVQGRAWTRYPINPRAERGLSAEGGRLFFRVSRALAQAPSIENFLRSAAYFTHASLGVLPKRVDLAVPIEAVAWHAEDFRLDAISLAENAGDDVTPVMESVLGAYRRRRESLEIFRAQNSEILSELKSLDSFVILELSEVEPEPLDLPFGANPFEADEYDSEAFDSEAFDSDPYDSQPYDTDYAEPARYQVLIPCALRGELGAVLSLYFVDSPTGPDSEATEGALAILIGQLEPLAAAVLDAHHRVRRGQAVLEENRYWRERQRRHHFYKDFIAESDAAREVYEKVNECVSHDEPVLLLGEAGSGKALIARAIHHLSPRKDAMLTAINCRSLKGDDLDFELFGSANNQLTGDTDARTGIFELAEGGTVFLEEIDRLSLLLQGKILRMLRESEVRRTGEAAARPVNVRLIASTHRDLRKRVEAGHFRRDLYMVLSKFPLTMPSLRERPEDILPLARTFLSTYRRRYGRAAQRFSSDVEAIFMAHAWRGNVRELKSVIEAAVLQSDGDVIEVKHLGL